MPRLTAEQLATRREGMGSTDIVEVCGLAPWSGAGPMRTFCEKIGIKPPDDAEADEDENDADHLRWGHVMEPVIADWYAAERGCHLILGGQVPSREHPFIWATLDRAVEGQNRLVEIKNVGSPKLYAHWNASSEDGVPGYVRAQTTVAMHCHGARETDVVACIGGRPPHVWRVSYDEELAGMLLAGALKFWELVKAGTPPRLDHTPASKEYLRAKYPMQRDKVIIEADMAADDLAKSRIECAVTEGRVKKEIQRIDAELLARIGDHDGMTGGGWKMTWRLDKNSVRRQRFTVRAERGEE